MVHREKDERDEKNLTIAGMIPFNDAATSSFSPFFYISSRERSGHGGGESRKSFHV